MATSIELTREYGYVVLVLVAYSFLNLWMGIQVGKARRKYKVSYPTMYAVESENKDAKLFNCIQSAERAPELAGGDAALLRHAAARWPAAPGRRRRAGRPLHGRQALLLHRVRHGRPPQPHEDWVRRVRLNC